MFRVNSPKFFSALSLALKVGKAVIAERVITFLTRVLDVAMVWIIINDPTLWGAMKAFIYITPLNIVFCGAVVWTVNVFAKRGIDITGIDEFREMTNNHYSKRQYVKRFAQWVLRRRKTIFWIGSWFYLDPDYVTLLLRRKGEGFWTTIWRITVPSTVLAMVVWTPIYWLSWQGVLRGYEWARWFLEP